MNIPVVTSIPSSPDDGDTVLLRLGSTPFDFLLLTYDSTYGKWVSLEFPIVCTEQSVSTGSSAAILGSIIQIGDYKNFYDAGLSPQVRAVGRYTTNNSDGTATVRGTLATGNPQVSAATQRGTTPGATSPLGSTEVFNFDSGWQDFDSSNPSSDALAFVRLELVRNIAGTANVSNRQWWLRWVNTP